jgi:divalent metal cation (Fe/Co/Zn/Cd) transporter
LIAFVGIFSAQTFATPWADGAGSVVIGCILCSVAVLLAYESRSLLVGEGADRQTLGRIREIVSSDSSVESVGNPLTMYFGPETILLTLDISFRPCTPSSVLGDVVDRIESAIRTEFPKIKHIFLEARSLTKNRDAEGRVVSP